MILLILFLAIFVAAIVLMILGSRWDNVFLVVPGAVLGIIFGICSLVAVGSAILNNTPHECAVARIRYEQDVTRFVATREAIYTISDDYARTVAVQQYNTEVSEFKVKILQEQARLNNPWISWFTCHAYSEFDANVVSYIDTIQ